MSWWNLGLLLLMVIGHAQLWIALINRLHALPLNHKVLRQVRHVHDVAILAFPLWLIGSLGSTVPRLLTCDTGSGACAVWITVMGLCAAGVVGLVRSVVRYQLKSPPPVLKEERSETIDIARQLGGLPVAAGPYRWMTRLPGNEQFTVELTEKRLVLSRWPEVWNGLRILHLSDWHLMPTIDRSYFECVTRHALSRPADLVIFSGDLVDDLDCLSWLPETIGRIDARLGRYFILGNHDRSLDAELIRRQAGALGWQNIAGRTFTIESEGRRLVLGGDETPWIGVRPDFSRTDQDDVRLLVSHTPDHVHRARRDGVDLMLSGHNHGGQVVLPVVGPVYAPSRFGVTYTDGVFWRPPTVLHVSRGLSGEHPFRWRCRPEITWLVLERGPA